MKKKLLALLLTIMMVAILVPAIVVSALVPSALDGGAGDAAPDERAEVATHDPLLEEDNVEVFNKNGVRVGYYATLAEAVAELHAGDTVNLLEDLMEAGTLVLSGKWTLNANNYTLMITENSAGKTAAVEVVGNGTDITVNNLNLVAPVDGVLVTAAADADVVELTLVNCKATAISGSALIVDKANCRATVKGISGAYEAQNAAVINRGYTDIYAGKFSTVVGPETLKADGNADATAVLAVYGGTVLSGAEAMHAVSTQNGGWAILADGEYANRAKTDPALTGRHVISATDGEIFVLGGKYFAADEDANAVACGTDGALRVWGGYFYGQKAVDLTSATVEAGYTTKTYAYEDPTFPANADLAYVKELGYLAMTEVAYDTGFLAENGYTSTVYEVTNGVYNDNPVSYYGFELERAYLYLGNGGSLTLTGDAAYTSDSAISFRCRPQTSEVTLKSAAVGSDPFVLRTYMEGNYLLVATGGTYNIANVALINEKGPAILLDRDNTDAVGCVLNLQKGATVAGYSAHAVLVGAHATMNMYAGAYVHAAAGVSGNYDGSGIGLVTMIGGQLNMYGGSLGYVRAADENGRMLDLVCTGNMNTVYTAVGEGPTCASKINIYNGKLGKSAIDQATATAIFNMIEIDERIDGTSLYIENGEFNSSLNNIIRAGHRNISIHIKGGVFNGPTAQCSNANHSDLILVDGESTEVRNRVVIEGGTFKGGRDQFSICDYALVTVSGSYHTGAMSAVFACHGNADSPVNVTDVTVESAVHAFWCNGSAINVTGGSFTIKSAAWAKNAFAVEGDTTAGDINIVGGTYSVSAGYFINVVGLAQRTVTVTDSEFNSIGGSCFRMSTEGRADLIVNSGTFSNMYGTSHQIETWGDPTKTLGSVTINGGNFVRGGNASGRMIKFYGGNNVTINGGYFHSETSEAIVIEKSADLTFEPDLTFTVNGGKFYNKATGKSLIYINSNALVHLVITGGEFLNEAGTPDSTWAPCLDLNSKNGSTDIYGGSFASICALSNSTGSDACITVGNTICNIYAGTFRGNGMCVARGLSGSTGGETDVNGKINTVANSRLNIYGGVFTLEKNDARTALNCGHDAVVRCGGGSTYAFVTIHGGTFIDNSTCSDRVINKNNVHSSIKLTGGVFLASGAQEFYYKSSGMANTGGSEFPTEPYAKSYSDPTVNHGGKQYHQLVVGAGSSPFNGEMEEGAQIRLTYDGESYNGGLRFASFYNPTASEALKGMAGGDIGHVAFGTLIIKTELLNGLYNISHEALKYAGIEDYLDVVAVDGVSGSESVGYTVTASVSNITVEDYGTSYSAVGYAMVELADGNKVYFYTDFDEEKNSRSLTQVAQAALDDVSDSQTQGYVYAHVTMEGKFSRYTPEQQNVLLSYIPTT